MNQFRRKFSRARLWSALVLAAAAGPTLPAQVTVAASGMPQAVILTPPNPTGYVAKAAQELQLHWQLMSGATVPVDTVGHEANYPGKAFVYVGKSSATTAAGISTSGLPLEYYIIRTIGPNLYIVGVDGGKDDWTNLTDCQPGTMFGVYYLLNEVLGVCWLWPGNDGIVTPSTPTITVPALNVTFGSVMVMRKFRTPRIGLYLGGTTTYGSLPVPVLPADPAVRLGLANDDLLWMRRVRLGSRLSPSFGHSETTWWAKYGATHPEYFAVLFNGAAQPKPNTTTVKLRVGNPVTVAARVKDWQDAGASNSFNICPNDSRNFDVSPESMAWDYPAQDASIVNSDSSALLGDRYARWYTEVANAAKAINPKVTVYGYAYDVYKNAPFVATVPSNVALEYIPPPPSDVIPSLIQQTQTNFLGWVAHGCTQMYLRPNWMLSAHAGPFLPIHRLGNHFKDMLATGKMLGLDSDSSCSSYAGFGPYYYLVARLMANPGLSVDGILDEYCSGFGSAAAGARAYFTYWENFIYNQGDAGNTAILGWSSGMAAYGTTYTDDVFDGAEKILDEAEASLGPGETAARNRFEFLRLGCVHGRLTAAAIRLVDPNKTLAQNPAAERAMRSLLAYRNAYAGSFALWREWMIDREGYGTPNMGTYWKSILANPNVGNGSNAGAFTETNGQVVLEAEDATSTAAGTGSYAAASWQTYSSAAGASGTTMQVQPVSGLSSTSTAAPRLDFKVDFRTTGTWYVHVRLPALATASNAVNIGLDGVITGKTLQNTSGAWSWIKTLTTTSTRATVTVTSAGVHTVNVWMGKDGVVVDRLVLSPSSAFTLADADIGPAESDRRAAAEALLIVGRGTGDGSYGQSSLVSITAETAPANQVFDRWTGDTSALANPLSATTVVTMPAGDIRVDATYQLDPTLDTNGNGMPDAWEIAQFGNLTTATATSDHDHDGFSDVDEYIAGTDPNDAKSNLTVTFATPPDNNGDCVVQWPGVAGNTYQLLVSTDLVNWTPVAIDIPGTAPVTTYSLRLPAGPKAFLRIATP